MQASFWLKVMNWACMFNSIAFASHGNNQRNTRVKKKKIILERK